MRFLKLILGAVLVVGGLYVLVGEHFAGTSADATINARTVVVRAPIEGQLSLDVHDIGGRVDADETLGTILDDRFDNTRLLDLERGRQAEELDRTRVQTQRALIAAARKSFEAQIVGYQRGRVQQIQARLAESEAAKAAANARFTEAGSQLQRASQLSQQGVQTQANLDRARSVSDVAKQELESARQRSNYLETELASAKTGVFIGDSYNDAPFSVQRARELELRSGELGAEEAQLAARLTQSDAQIAAERVRENRLTSATLKARAPGVVWDFLVDDGEYVRRGQDLLRLVDCTSLVVTASVTESLYDKLRLGDRAQLRLYGESRVLDSTIIRLGGSGAETLYANLAVGPSSEHLKRFDVTLMAPDLLQSNELNCAVGRTGRVIFTQGPISAFRGYMTRYGL